MAFINAFSECEMRFTKGPIFIAHQVQHRQQLRLGELPFAELRAVIRQHRLVDFQGQAGRVYQSDLCHRCARRLQSGFSLTRFRLRPSNLASRMSTKPDRF